MLAKVGVDNAEIGITDDTYIPPTTQHGQSDDDEVEVVLIEVLEGLHDKVDRSEAAARARIRRGQPGVQSVGPNENLGRTFRPGIQTPSGKDS